MRSSFDPHARARARMRREEEREARAREEVEVSCCRSLLLCCARALSFVLLARE